MAGALRLRTFSPVLVLFLLGGCYLDGLGGCQDLFSARLLVVSLSIVQLKVFYQLVVGIGPYSEATTGASDLFRHA